jgi:type IV pilus assembly protein PilX
MNRMKLNRNQRGATLIVGLIFLVALTLLGVMAMKSTLLQERMAGGSRDHSLAFQAAEAALRDAKRDILSLRADGTTCTPGSAGCRPATDRPWESAGRTPFTSTCTNGQCYDNPAVSGYGFGVGNQAAWLAYPLTGAPSIDYGFFTGAVPIAGVATQPRYLIEIFLRSNSQVTRYFYRITARGVGANPNTAVVLQEVFAP